MSTKEDIDAAKLQLKEILKENNGSTANEAVLKAVEDLSVKWKNCTDSSIVEIAREPSTSIHRFGVWNQISAPTFPGRIVTEGKEDAYQFTLGRISFNIFQPKNMVCTIEGTVNIVEETRESHEELGNVTYNLKIPLTFHTPSGDLPGEILNQGYCYSDPEIKTRSVVAFVGGVMCKPDSVTKDPKLTKLWEETFGNAYTKADQERGYVEAITMFIMKMFLKLEMPSDDNVRFEMKRIMKGYLDYLYLDDNFRITKGNKGTIVVVEK